MQQLQKIIDELVFLGPVRVQKVWGLFNSIFVMELFSPTHKRIYFLFDQNPKTASIHIQKNRPQGLKTQSPFILAVKKRAVGQGFRFYKERSDSQVVIAKIGRIDHEATIFFNLHKQPYSVLFDGNKFVISSNKNISPYDGDFLLSDEHEGSSFEANLAEGTAHEAKLIDFYRNDLVRIKIKEINISIKKRKNLIENILRDRQKFAGDLLLAHTAELLKMNFSKIKPGASEVRLWDYLKSTPEEVTVVLDKRLKPKEQLESLFKKVKRAKRGINHIDERIKNIQDDLAVLEDRAAKVLAGEVDVSTLAPVEHENKPLAKGKKKQGKRLPYREFISSDGLKIWVGKSAKDCDELTLRYAKGNDWWFHARDVTGAHVVVKHSTSELPAATFLESAMLAAHYSEAKDEGRVTISYTQAKNVKKTKGLAFGQVLISNEKTAEIKMDKDRLAALLQMRNKER